MTMEIVSLQLTTPQKVRYLFSGVNVFINILQQCIVALARCPCNKSCNYNILYCTVFLPSERVEVTPEVEGDIDQFAVLTSNVLFFVILFIFAVFET